MNESKAVIKIRRAQVSDADAIAHLLYESFAEYRSLYSDKGFAATTPSAKDIEERIDQKVVWLVLLDDRIAGTVSIFSRGDELYVRSMAVSPQAQGKGIGRLLMEHIHEMAYSHGCSSITLYTTSFLLSAIRLYGRSGFAKVGIGDLHGTALIRMTKNLKMAINNKIENNDYAK